MNRDTPMTAWPRCDRTVAWSALQGHAEAHGRALDLRQLFTDDPERAQRLSAELRCLVCQNQTIADSQAELAMQLKREVRQQLARGASDQQVRDFMVQRYGDFVLYRPPLNDATVWLWGGPLLLLALGLGALVWQLLRHRPEEGDPT